MQQTYIHCIDQLEGGTSFGIRADTGESVFIPASISKRVGLAVGDTCNARLIVNAMHPDKTPWYAVFISIADPDEVVASQDNPNDLMDRVLDFVEATPAYVTALEVSNELDGINERAATEALEQLFNGRRVVRAAVMEGPGESTPAAVLWARDVETILAVEE